MKKRKIIFLDINGVIQPANSYKRAEHNLEKLKVDLTEKYSDNIFLQIHKSDLGVAFYDWKKSSLELLKKLVDEDGAEIVISSSWRVSYPINVMKKLFSLFGMEQCITDYTPIGNSRGSEIMEYLTCNKDIESFVVLDDMYVTELSRKFNFRFIHIIDFFDKDDFKKAKDILHKKLVIQ